MQSTNANSTAELLTVLRDVNSPPGGWKYTPPQTGVTLTSQFYNGLLPKVLQHLKANGVEITDELLLEIEDGACRETPAAIAAGWCRKREPKPIAGMPIPLLSAVEAFLRCVWSAIISRQFVPREEAQRRLEICLVCPLRSEAPSGCSGCYSLLKKANSLMERKGALVIPPDGDGTVRDACSACWCLVSLKPWLSNGTLDKCEGERRPPYHSSCWRLEN